MSSEAVRTNPEALRMIADTVRAFSTNQTALIDEYLAAIRGIAGAWDDEEFQKVYAEITVLTAKLAELTDHVLPFPRYLDDLAGILETRPAQK